MKLIWNIHTKSSVKLPIMIKINIRSIRHIISKMHLLHILTNKVDYFKVKSACIVHVLHAKHITYDDSHTFSEPALSASMPFLKYSAFLGRTREIKAWDRASSANSLSNFSFSSASSSFSFAFCPCFMMPTHKKQKKNSMIHLGLFSWTREKRMTP